MRASTPSPSFKNRAFGLLAVAFWVAVWWAFSAVINQPIVLPSPGQALARLVSLLGEFSFYRAIGNSLLRILLGFLLALSAGVGLAVIAFFSRFVRTLLGPPMAAVSATPIASFAILALVLIGKANLSVFISFLMVLPVIYLNVLKGLESADGKLLEMALVFRLSRGRQARAIYAPAAFPYLLSAVKIGLGMCWKSGLAAEVIGQPDFSIGDALFRAKTFVETDAVFAWTIAIILISVCLERLAVGLINRFSAKMGGGGA